MRRRRRQNGSFLQIGAGVVATAIFLYVIYRKDNPTSPAYTFTS